MGAFFFISSVTLANCAGSLIVAGGCEGWQRDVILGFWLVGALAFSLALAILVFRFVSSAKHNPTQKNSR